MVASVAVVASAVVAVAVACATEVVDRHAVCVVVAVSAVVEGGVPVAATRLVRMGPRSCRGEATVVVSPSALAARLCGSGSACARTICAPPGALRLCRDRWPRLPSSSGAAARARFVGVLRAALGLGRGRRSRPSSFGDCRPAPGRASGRRGGATLARGWSGGALLAVCRP